MPVSGLDRVAKIVHDVHGVVEGAALRRVQAYVGGRSKGLALGHAAKDLGGDRAMHNYKGGKLRLGAGWDAVPGGVAVNFRPAGVWKLVDQGRKRSGVIVPKRRRRRGARPGARRAIRMPDGGYVAFSHYGPSRGLGTFGDSERDIERRAAANVDAAIARELRRVVG